ncbi:MAG: DUF6106 family protein [Eubacteriales bacterium]|nr:DUF6106 family protein [Eubacteriales bacterium]
MSDLYTELLVKKERTSKDTLIRFGIIAGTAVFVFAGLFISPLLLIPAIACGVAAYFIVPRTDLEFEYLFINGDLDIDMIMSKAKRKKAKSVKMEEIDLVAPLNSHRLDYYNNNQNIRVLDYSSGNAEHKRYALIGKDDKGLCKIIIEPDEALANAMKNCAPGKVFLD